MGTTAHPFRSYPLAVAAVAATAALAAAVRDHVAPVNLAMLFVLAVVALALFLVRGASALAGRLGMSPLIVGLTVVAFATSAPELAVTLGSVVRGEPGLAVGNVVGSNIANVLLIVGTSALVLPLLVKVQLVRIDIPFMLALSVPWGSVSLSLAITSPSSCLRAWTPCWPRSVRPRR